MIEAMARYSGGHALSTAMLGSLASSLFGGDASLVRAIDLRDAARDDALARRLTSVLASYAEGLREIEREILSRIAIFPRGLDAATLGFGISEWAAAPSGKAIVIAEHTDFTYTVECYDPELGLANALPPTSDWLANPEIDAQGRVWIPVRSFSGASGLIVVDAETCDFVTDAPIATTLPPYRVAFY